MVNAGDHKERFDRLQPDDMTQAEFVAELLDHYEHTDAEGMADLLAVLDRLDELEERLGAKAELGAYRGVKDYLEQ